MAGEGVGPDGTCRAANGDPSGAEAFYPLLLRLESSAFRLAGLRDFSGLYRLVDVDDAAGTVIIARERDGQRLGLSIADFLEAYRQGRNA